MAFTVDIKENEFFPVIVLKNTENAIAEVYAFGALLNKFSINNSINIIDGFISAQDAIENIAEEFHSAKLSPYACRIAKNKYLFNGDEHIITKLNPNKEAIHGLLYDATFSIIESGANDHAAFVRLQYDYSKKDEGFPFNYSCVVTYALEHDNTLLIETTIKNNSVTAMPICDGWHPYFTLGCKIDELSFEINANKMIELSDKLVPTGNIIEYKKFQHAEIIDNSIFDNCFLLNENDKAACVLRNNSSGLALTIKPDRSYPFLQVYTPGNRKSIAIENLSSPPDAFNNKTGLKVLKPDETFTFKTIFIASFKL